VPIIIRKAILFILSFILVSCSVAVQNNVTATSVPSVNTATLPPISTTRPTETSLPPPAQPTIAPIEGITSTQLNVRAEPSTASEVLGIIPANSKVQIVGKDIGEGWWQIKYEAGDEGKGWVTSQYVETVDKPEVPVIGTDGITPSSGSVAIVIQQLNIRSGPDTRFNTLGTLNANDVVNLTGKNENGTWLQISFPNGPNNKGWVNAGFVKVDDMENLPIILDSGEVIGTGTPVDTPLPPTPTLVPAPMDFDSPDNPIKTVLLGGVGTHTALYNGDVSFPEGDTEDWISIIPQEDMIFASVTCLGNDAIQIEFVETGFELICNGTVQAIPTQKGVPFLIHIRALGPANQLEVTNYVLQIGVRQ